MESFGGKFWWKALLRFYDSKFDLGRMRTFIFARWPFALVQFWRENRMNGPDGTGGKLVIEVAEKSDATIPKGPRGQVEPGSARQC